MKFLTTSKVRAIATTAFALVGMSAFANNYTYTFSDGAGNVGNGNLSTAFFGITEVATTGDLTITGGVLTGNYSLLFTSPNPPNQVLSPLGAFNYDNVINPTEPLLTNNGLLFSSGAGPTYREVNIFNNNAPFDYSMWSAAADVNGTWGGGWDVSGPTGGQFSMQAVPEPASMAVLGFGLVGILRRRRAKRA